MDLLHSSRYWSPPIGIPAPSLYFNGLDPINIPLPINTIIAPGWFEITPRANSIANGDIHNCYYVDNTHGAATDTSNTFGYPTKPRLTIPNIIFVAGSYIEIHGDGASGTFKYTVSIIPKGEGTSTNPIWFVGVNRPIFSSVTDLGSNNLPSICYMIFDGIYWRNGGRISVRPRFSANVIHHIVFRNCDIKGQSLLSDGNGISIGTAIKNDTQLTHDIIVYNCNIYNFGDKNNPNEQCGIYPVFYLTRLWVLDNFIHDVAEDGLAGSHDGTRTSSYYYIGRNRIYNNLTNAIDIKGMTNIIISENIIFDHFDIWIGGIHKSSGQGESIVPHYSGNSSGPTSWLNFPDEVSIIFNTIYNSRYAIATSRCGKLRIVGNVIYNIHSVPTDYTTTVEGILINGVKDNQWVIDNTIYGCDGGIRITDGPMSYNSAITYFKADGVSFNNKTFICINDNNDIGITNIDPSNPTFWVEIHLYIKGNIFSGRTKTSQSEIDFDEISFANNSIISDYNILHCDSGEVVFYGNTTPHDLAWLKANTTHDIHSLNNNPLFIDANTKNFKLQNGSPAISANIEGMPSVYDNFFDTYGINIKYDRAIISRPQDINWDIGAYESVGS